MKQSRSTSFLKSVVSTAVGFAVAFLANMIILPWFGLPISPAENLLLTTIYTVISIARGYALERAFEAMGWRTRMSAFALAVLAERQRQIHVEGYSAHDDDELPPGRLTGYGDYYASKWFVQKSHSEQRRHLVKAAALILAEGERFDRCRKRNPVPSVPCLAHSKSRSEHAGAPQ